jgi:hypothetical protein
MEGAAFDISMANHDPAAFEAAAREVGFLGFGFYPRSGFMQIDLGPARQWGERFPVRATAFSAETPPAREVLADSRTLKGGGAAGVATLGAAGVEVAQSVIAETQTAILPLVPYLDTLALGVHRGGARRHRGHDLRAARRLAPGAAVIGGLLTGIATSPWMRAALRYGAIASQCSCSCFRFGAPGSERDASPNALRPRRRPMTSNAGCWRRRLAVLAIATSLLSGCATVGSENGQARRRARPWSSMAGSSRRGGRGAGPAAGGIGARGDVERLRRDAGAGAPRMKAKTQRIPRAASSVSATGRYRLY